MVEIIGFIMGSLLLFLLVLVPIILLLRAIALKALPRIDSSKNENKKGGNYFWFKGRRYRREGKNKKKLDQIYLEDKTYDIDKINNPDINLYKKNDIKLHFQRLEKFGRSKWNREMYFKGERGGIYTISASGTRNYKY